jgi:hypothetical protein
MYQVLYMDRKGAGNMRAFPDSDAVVKFLKGLRCEATVINGSGEQVGEVTDAHKGYHNPDDKRVRWLWWMENDG